MVKYVWCEDKGSGFDFWKAIFASIDNGIIVETKKNNSELIKAVSKNTDADNKYYILVDNAIDNPIVVRELRYLDETVKAKNNVFVEKMMTSVG